MPDYGHFDEEAREYVITRPDTPAPWINYLMGGGLYAFLSQTAGGVAFYHEPAEGRLTRYRFNGLPVDSPGFYTYVQDGKDIWNPSYRPTMTPVQNYRCRHGMGYTIYEAEKRGLAARVTFVIPPEDPILLWAVRLENRTDQPRPVKLTTYAEFSLHTFFKDNLAYLVCGNQWRLTYDKRLRGILIDYFAFESLFQGQTIFSSNRPVSAYEIDRDKFIGFGRTEANPIGLERGLQNSEVPDGGRYAAGVLQNSLTVPAGKSKDVVYRYAVTEKFAKSEKLLDKYPDYASVEGAVQEVRKYWDLGLSAAQPQTPDAGLNAMLGTWLPYNAGIVFTIGRSISTRHTGGGGALRYRDSMQDAMPSAWMFPQQARERIRRILHTLYQDGHATCGVNPDTLQPNPGETHLQRSDAAVWGIMTVYNYLAETGDLKFLDEAIPFLDGGESTVFDHLVRSMKYIAAHTGKDGLPSLFTVDWNDFLQIFTVAYTGCQSVMVAEQFIYAGRLLQEIAAEYGHSEAVKFVATASKRFARILDSDTVWDGSWYRRVLGDELVMGSKKSADAKIFLNTQSWAVIAGVLDAQHTRQALDEVHKRLNTPWGIRIFAPPFRKMPDGKRVCANTPGAGENGGIFLHANTWAIMAEALLGHGDRAWEYYSQILPVNLSGKDPDRYLNEPYAFSSWVYGPDHERYGGGQLSWLTGGVAWMNVVGWQYILGIRPTLQGLKIAPCIPHEWESFQVQRRWRGTEYEITVSNPEHLCSGKVQLVVDGKPFPGDLLPPARKKRVKVEATITEE
ncbi:MAG: hypothetical protein GX100_06295 [candidate division WS1 bacterium]|nr:hypothetical protein [candidate division WS1 bacterium]